MSVEWMGMSGVGGGRWFGVFALESRADYGYKQ
jgi:hypothetical protein